MVKDKQVLHLRGVVLEQGESITIGVCKSGMCETPARKLELAPGFVLERDLVVGNRILQKKGASMVLLDPSHRRGRGRVAPDSDTFNASIDAAHTAMLLYADEGAGVTEGFLNKTGMLGSPNFGSLLLALVNAAPRVKKSGKLDRPEARA